ncbi:hypothetical protein OIO90_003915 [Microbotryomycetes sp. JL221]|nr:hypothetical protein OIO90_003915 [Microbotryomycetes sp. JL221]
MSGIFVSSRVVSPAESRSSSRSRQPLDTTSTPPVATGSRTGSPSRLESSLNQTKIEGVQSSSSRSRSTSRTRNAFNNVKHALFSSHAHQDLSFANDKGLERQAREANSRSQSRSGSPSRHHHHQIETGSRSQSRSRLTEAIKKAFVGSEADHQKDLMFANDKGLERALKSRSQSRAASRSQSRARTPVQEEDAEDVAKFNNNEERGRAGMPVASEYTALRA